MEKLKDFISLIMSFYGEAIFIGFYSLILFSPVVCFRSAIIIYRKQQKVTTANSQDLFWPEGYERQVLQGRVNNLIEHDRKNGQPF